MAIQLKTLMALGTATRKVRRENTTPAVSLWPLTYMWWPQTREPTLAIARLENAMVLYPKMFLRENTGMMSEMTPMAGKDHDVDGRMGVDPEQMLIEEGVTALGRVEDADAEDPLDEDQDHRDADDRGRQDLDPRGGVDAPDGKGQAGRTSSPGRAPCGRW